MPTAPKQHRAIAPMRSKDDRPSASARGYNRPWRRLRRAKLARDPLCVQCERDGITTPAVEVDHIRPLNDGGDHSWGNLQSLCKTHHSRKTASDKAARAGASAPQPVGVGGSKS